MTVSTEISSNEYTGNGVTTDFDYKFRIFKASDLSVTTSDADGDNVVTLRLGTDYTVTEVNKSAGGKVLLTRPLADKHQISITRVIPIVQETSFRNQGKFLAETHEDAFDYLTMLMQRVWGSLSLFLKRPSVLANWFDAKGYRISNLGKPKKDSDAVDLGTMKGAITTSINRSLRVDDMDILALPKVSERRNKQIGFNNAGIPILLDPSETGGLGYVLVDSFEKGALITARYQALHFKFQGEYYRWDGDLPKQVPAGSTPQSTGGIGKGAWISVGDASLRSDINKYNLLSKYGLDESGIIAARAAFDATGVKTYVPDITIDVSFDSEYKLNHLVGVGKLNWNGRVFDIGLASGYKQLKTVGGRIADMSAGVTVRVGCIGDSTTDGYGTEPFSDNPFITGSDGKKIPLSTTNHSDNGGVSAWPTKLRTLLRDYHRNQNIEVFNGGYGGTGIGSPANSYCWPYKHYERIFFENEFYAAPHLTIISFGINEAVTTDVKRTQDVINGYRELIYKIKGFGATPVVITPDPLMLTSYSKKSVEEFIPAMKSLCIDEGVTLIDTHKEIRNFWANSEYAWGAYQTDGVHQKTIAHDFKSGFIAKNLMGAVVDVLEDNYISSMEQYAHPLNQQPTRNFQNNKFGVVGNCSSSQSFDFWVYVSGSNFNAVWYDFNANYVKSDAISIDDMYSFTVKAAINYQNAYISKNGRQNYPSSVTYSDSPNLLGVLRYGLNRITVKMPSSNCAIGRYSGYLGVHKKTVIASSQSYLTKIGKRIYEPAPKIINNVVSAANAGDVSYISLALTLSENVGFIVIEDKNSESVTSYSGWSLYRSGRDNIRLFKYKGNSASDLGVVFTDYADDYHCTIKLEVNSLGNKTVTIYDKSANVVFTSAELETCGHVGGIWGGNDTGGNVAKHAKAIVDIQKVI